MILTIFCWVALILFVGLSLKKAKQFSSLPMHGRQDLYPIPLEDTDKAKYGGSYMEEDRWFEKKLPHNTGAMIIDMLGEMLFIKKLFVNQNKFWWVSYSLHLGIYAALAWTVLLFVGAFAGQASVFGTIVYVLVTIAGVVAGVLMTIGAAGLIIKRMTQHEFKAYTTPQEFFNLFFLLAVAVTGLLTFILNGCTFNYGYAITYAMTRFQSLPAVCAGNLYPVANTGILYLHILLLGAVMIYIPLCKMSHYVGKYFTFHSVIWDNRPNMAGSKVEETIIAESGIKPAPGKNWAAPHYQPAPAPEAAKEKK